MTDDELRAALSDLMRKRADVLRRAWAVQSDYAHKVDVLNAMLRLPEEERDPEWHEAIHALTTVCQWSESTLDGLMDKIGELSRQQVAIKKELRRLHA